MVSCAIFSGSRISPSFSIILSDLTHTNANKRRDQNFTFNRIYNILICLFGETCTGTKQALVRQTLFVDESNWTEKYQIVARFLSFNAS